MILRWIQNNTFMLICLGSVTILSFLGELKWTDLTLFFAWSITAVSVFFVSSASYFLIVYKIKKWRKINTN